MKFTDVQQKAIDDLLFQFRYKKNFRALMQAMSRPEVEEEAFSLTLAMGIDEATGDQLDILGKWVQEQRGGMVDPDYRDIIKAKVRALSSSGTAPEIVGLLAFMLDVSVEYSTSYPAGIRLQYVGQRPAEFRRRASRLLQVAKAPGVSLDVVYGTDDDVFRFGGPFGKKFGSKWT